MRSPTALAAAMTRSKPAPHVPGLSVTDVRRKIRAGKGRTMRRRIPILSASSSAMRSAPQAAEATTAAARSTRNSSAIRARTSGTESRGKRGGLVPGVSMRRPARAIMEDMTWLKLLRHQVLASYVPFDVSTSTDFYLRRKHICRRDHSGVAIVSESSAVRRTRGSQFILAWVGKPPNSDIRQSLIDRIHTPSFAA